MSVPAPELLDLAKSLARVLEARNHARSKQGVEHAKKPAGRA